MVVIREFVLWPGLITCSALYETPHYLCCETFFKDLGTVEMVIFTWFLSPRLVINYMFTPSIINFKVSITGLKMGLPQSKTSNLMIYVLIYVICVLIYVIYVLSKSRRGSTFPILTSADSSSSLLSMLHPFSIWITQHSNKLFYRIIQVLKG